MNPLRWVSALLVALAVAAGASLWLQRQAGAALRDEIVLLREEQAELARLRAERDRLRAAQPSAAELERLRADRAAIGRLRAEIDRLNARTDEKARSVAQATAPLIPSAEWRNAGRASPRDAMSTLLWAGTQQDVAAFAGTLAFDAASRPYAEQVFAALPEAVRAQHGSMERLVARQMMKEAPPPAARIIDEKLVADDLMIVAARVQNADGRETITRYPFRRTADGWRMELPLPAVQRIAHQLGAGFGTAK